MTDKQIIIDGVDVSGCEYYNKINKHTGQYCICELEPNCLYKQLKRKEQECEGLKEGYSELTDIVSPYMDDFTGYNEELGGFDIVLCIKELLEQLDQLKAENEELKVCLFQVQNASISLTKQLDQLKAENEQLKNFHINLVGVKECEIRELNQLKADNKHLNDLLNQALKELEEHREALEKIEQYCKANRYSGWVDVEGIMQICDEVNKDDSIEDDLSGHWLFDKEV